MARSGGWYVPPWGLLPAGPVVNFMRRRPAAVLTAAGRFSFSLPYRFQTGAFAALYPLCPDIFAGMAKMFWRRRLCRQFSLAAENASVHTGLDPAGMHRGVFLSSFYVETAAYSTNSTS